jgi:hypothetical protein
MPETGAHMGPGWNKEVYPSIAAAHSAWTPTQTTTTYLHMPYHYHICKVRLLLIMPLVLLFLALPPVLCDVCIYILIVCSGEINFLLYFTFSTDLKYVPSWILLVLVWANWDSYWSISGQSSKTDKQFYCYYLIDLITTGGCLPGCPHLCLPGRHGALARYPGGGLRWLQLHLHGQHKVRHQIHLYIYSTVLYLLILIIPNDNFFSSISRYLYEFI